MKADHVCFCDLLPTSLFGHSRTLPASAFHVLHGLPTLGRSSYANVFFVLVPCMGLLPKLSDKVSCWLGPWDYSVEGTQKRSLGGFSEEGLGASGFS